MTALSDNEKTLLELEAPGHAVVMAHRRHCWARITPSATDGEIEAARSAHAAAVQAHKAHAAAMEERTGFPLSRLIDAAAQRVIDAREQADV